MDPKQFDITLHDAEVKLKRLKALYEQWFQGIERIEPAIARKDLERTFVLLKKEKPRNTAARFRLQQLHARFVTYQTYWSRIARKIEEGTYERDLRRVRARAANRAAMGAGNAIEIDIEEDLSEFDQDDEDDLQSLLDSLEDYVAEKEAATPKQRPLSAFTPTALAGRRPPTERSAPDTERPAPNVAPRAAEPARPAAMATFGKPTSRRPPAGDGAFPNPQTGSRPMVARAPKTDPSPAPSAAGTRAPRLPESARVPSGSDPMRALYDNYVAARRRNNEQVDMGYDKMASRVQQMRSQLEQKHAGKKIDFEVVVQNGRVGLRPKIM